MNATQIEVGMVVRVQLRAGGSVQSGTVVSVHGDRFTWKNACGYERTSWVRQVTDAPEAEKLDPYVAEWVAEEQG